MKRTTLISLILTSLGVCPGFALDKSDVLHLARDGETLTVCAWNNPVWPTVDNIVVQPPKRGEYESKDEYAERYRSWQKSIQSSKDFNAKRSVVIVSDVVKLNYDNDSECFSFITPYTMWESGWSLTGAVSEAQRKSLKPTLDVSGGFGWGPDAESKRIGGWDVKFYRADTKVGAPRDRQNPNWWYEIHGSATRSVGQYVSIWPSKTKVELLADMKVETTMMMRSNGRDGRQPPKTARTTGSNRSRVIWHCPASDARKVASVEDDLAFVARVIQVTEKHKSCIELSLVNYKNGEVLFVIK